MSPFKDESACTVNTVPEMIMNGGYFYENSTTTTTTTTTSDGETFGNLPQMPVGLYQQCGVALDGNDLFVTGEQDDFRGGKTFLYHSVTMEWEELQDMPTPRRSHMCEMVHNTNGEQEVITAGGHGYATDYDVTDLVEIYNLESRQWRTGQTKINLLKRVSLKVQVISGNPLPQAMEDATVVPFGEAFLLVGGYVGDVAGIDVTDTIYKYEILDDSWTLLDTKIPFPCYVPIALMVDIDIFPSCSDGAENGARSIQCMETVSLACFLFLFTYTTLVA